MANSFMYWNDCVEPDDLDAMWMDPVAVADIIVRRHFDSILDPEMVSDRKPLIMRYNKKTRKLA
ncbi:unnamed protein product [Brassica rapa]|uniref:Uncharacterized protein n=1 Tax=Brassica campestris TaxID=3711 RepID=A0A3P5YRP7_BRACM|nr:unnamed protein product [Brassica rapa]VDC65865.1 unnamed protein product [Brassica rapa]